MVTVMENAERDLKVWNQRFLKNCNRENYSGLLLSTILLLHDTYNYVKGTVDTKEDTG